MEMKITCCNHVYVQGRSCLTLATVACQAPLFTGFSWQEYWNCLPPPGDLPSPRVEHTSPVAPALQVDYFTTETPGKPRIVPTDTAESGGSICITQNQSYFLYHMTLLFINFISGGSFLLVA